jgi:pilus assembly protein CpaC
VFRQHFAPARQVGFATLLVTLLVCHTPLVSAQQVHTGPLQLRISQSSQRLEMTVNTSRVLTLAKKVPRVFVSDTSIIHASPISPTQVQISATKAGVTQVNLWDEDGNLFTVDVIVTRDATELRELLESEFPEATLRVRPLAQSVYISGYVPRPELVDEIISMARDYYDNVINGIAVGGVQQVALQVRVMEVSRTKLRQFGLDWAFDGDDAQVLQGSAGLIAQAYDGDARELVPGIGGDTVRIKLFGDASSFIGYLQALRADGLVKVLAEPTLVTMTGRPASFNSGGSFPILVPNGLGTVGIEFKQYGTRVDFVPIVLGNGNIRLEVRPSVSEVDEARGVQVNGVTVPGVTERTVETSVEMQAGQTLALAGLIQTRVEAEKQGVPYLGDLPWIGRAFSAVRERINEVELLVVVTPELVGPLDPHQVPQCGPGQLTVSPNDHELYDYGYLEVPNCCLYGNGGACGPDCAAHGSGATFSPRLSATAVSGKDAGMPTETDLQPPLIETVPESAPSSQVGAHYSAELPLVAPRVSPYLPAAQTKPVATPVGPGIYGPLGYDPLH